MTTITIEIDDSQFRKLHLKIGKCFQCKKKMRLNKRGICYGCFLKTKFLIEEPRR